MKTYLHRAGSAPTNNRAERNNRKAVLWRKVSLGAETRASVGPEPLFNSTDPAARLGGHERLQIANRVFARSIAGAILVALEAVELSKDRLSTA